MPDLIINFVSNPDELISESLKKLNLGVLNKSDLKAIISQLVKDSPNTPKEKLYGIAMSRVRGRAAPQDVLRILKTVKKK